MSVKSLEEFKTDIDILSLDIENLDDVSKVHVVQHFEETLKILKLGSSLEFGNPTKKIKLETTEIAIALKLISRGKCCSKRNSLMLNMFQSLMKIMSKNFTMELFQLAMNVKLSFLALVLWTSTERTIIALALQMLN